MKIAIKIESTNDCLMGHRYFWMKNVIGFNPKRHCANCLKGDYVENINLSTEMNTVYELEIDVDEIFYLCAVAKPYCWINNAHLAMKVCKGNQAKLKLWTGDIVIITNVKRLPFNNKAALNKFPNLGKQFLTCRNFQFGAQYF